jgi:hypothetical protein
LVQYNNIWIITSSCNAGKQKDDANSKDNVATTSPRITPARLTAATKVSAVSCFPCLISARKWRTAKHEIILYVEEADTQTKTAVPCLCFSREFILSYCDGELRAVLHVALSRTR